MTILVTFASKHGSTRGIAESIAAELETLGHETIFAAVSNVPSLERFDAAVIGSGVYMGRWLPEARDFIETHQPVLAGMPVWLFSNGPLGDQPPTPPVDIEALATMASAMDHETFAGNLDRGSLGFKERMIAKMVHAPTGDYRDWEAIRGWAFLISRSLSKQSAHQMST